MAVLVDDYLKRLLPGSATVNLTRGTVGSVGEKRDAQGWWRWEHIANSLPCVLTQRSNVTDVKNTVASIPLPAQTIMLVEKWTEVNMLCRFRVLCHKLCNHPSYCNLILLCILVSSAMLAAEDPLYTSMDRNQVTSLLPSVLHTFYFCCLIFVDKSKCGSYTSDYT